MGATFGGPPRAGRPRRHRADSSETRRSVCGEGLGSRARGPLAGAGPDTWYPLTWLRGSGTGRSGEIGRLWVSRHQRGGRQDLGSLFPSRQEGGGWRAAQGDGRGSRSAGAGRGLRRAGDLRVPARERTPLHLPVCGRLGTASTGLACAGRWHTGWTGRSRRGASQSPRRKGQGAEKKSPCASGKGLLVQNRGRKNTEMSARAGHQTPQRPELPRHGSARCLGPKKLHTKKREVPSFVAFVMGRGQFTRPDFGVQDQSVGGQQGYRSCLLERPTPDCCLRPCWGGAHCRKTDLCRAGTWLSWSEQGPRSCRSQRRRRGRRGLEVWRRAAGR